MSARRGRTTANRGAAAGFSLIEVMLAIAVVAVGLLGIASIQLHALRGGQAGRVFTQASELAHDHLEALRTQPVTNLTPTMLTSTMRWSSPTTLTAQVRNNQGTAVTTQNFERLERITDAGMGVWNIDVQVRWTNQNSNTVPAGGSQIVISTARHRIAATLPPPAP